ncbi:TonB family protein [Porticoccus sp. GXU_MW_L64]
MKRILGLVGALFIFSTSVSADVAETKTPEELKQQFSTAYQAFQKAKENDSPEAVKLSEKILDLGKQIYSEDSEVLGVLYHNAGVYQTKIKKKTQAKKYLRRALIIFEKLYGKSAPELIDPLMDLGHASQEISSPIEQRHYLRALKIAKKHKGETSLTVAQINLDAGMRLLERAGSHSARRYLRRAYRIYSEKLDSRDARIGVSAFYLGKFELSRKNYKKARDWLEVALPLLDAPGKPDHKFELVTHAFLVEAYQQTGEPEKANKHCQAIGKAKPWDPDQPPRSVFYKGLKYPHDALIKRIEGHVMLTITVDKHGFATNPEVLELVGADSFAKAAFDTIEEMRFVPRFENGQPVDTHGAEYKFTFRISR